MDELNINSVDAEQAEVVDQPIDEPQEQAETPEAESAPIEEAQKEEVAKPQQSKEDNAKFAQVRREAEAKARDKTISELFGKSHGIHTYEDYQKAIKEQEFNTQLNELIDKGVDDSVAKEIIETREFKKKLAEEAERERQFKEFVETFPDIDASTIPQEVVEMVNNGKDLTSAYSIWQMKNIDKIKLQVEQDTLKKLKQNSETSTGSIESTKDQSMNVDQVNKLLESMSPSARNKWIDANMTNLEKWGYFKNF